jgi:hypothetical protein
MRGKDDLYRLIKAMSKSEKRYFSIDANKSGKEGAKYLKLFRAINDMEEWDDVKLKKKFKTNLSSDKKYLYESILRSMRDYRSAKSKAAQVKERLMDSEYLYERGLYEQSQGRLAEAKALATELEDQFMLLKIGIDEKQFFVDTKRKVDADDFKKLDAVRSEILNKTSSEIKYLDLYVKLYIRTVKEFELKDEESKNQLKQEESIELLLPENMPISPRAQRRFFLCNAMYYRLLGETDKVYKYYSEVVNWWDKHLALKIEEFHRYVVDVSNLVNSCYQSGKYLDEAQNYVKKLQKEKEGASYNGQKIVFLKVSISNLLYHLNQSDFAAAEGVLPEIIDGMNRFGLNKSVVLVANIVTVYFLVGDYEKCITWCDYIVNNIKMGRRKDVHRIVRIYKLICLYELEKLDELESYLRAVQRFYRLEQVPKDRLEIILLNKFLRKIINSPISELQNTFTEMHKFLIDLQTNLKGEYLLGLDELIIWVSDKLRVRH